MTDHTLADGSIPFDIISFGLTVMGWVIVAGLIYWLIRWISKT